MEASFFSDVFFGPSCVLLMCFISFLHGSYQFHVGFLDVGLVCLSAGLGLAHLASIDVFVHFSSRVRLI